MTAGWPRFGSVRLRFGDGTVRAVPVFGSGGSSGEGVFVCFSTVSQRTVPVPVSVPGKRFWRFRFRVRFPGPPVPTVPVSGSGSVPGPPCDGMNLFCLKTCSPVL